ncbi:MAG: hypothetical protein ABIT01_02190 [Thermoanaerobaculia bacterium]
MEARDEARSGTLLPASQFGSVVFFSLLIAFVCAPIWAVDAFVPQDGPAHVQSASYMLGLLTHDPAVAQRLVLNSFALPNSSGHWLLALLLTFVSPLTATKVLATLTSAGLIAAFGFLRRATVGREGMKTSLLVGAAVSYNWLWLCGLSNFLIGVIGVAVAIGLFHKWRGALTARRVLLLSLVVLLVYLSHLVAFAVLAAALVLLAAAEPPPERRRASLGALVGLAPAGLCAALYQMAPSHAGERLFPVWRRLAEPLSFGSWLFHIRTADPFILISRRCFPFVAAPSAWFVAFTPLLWLLAALAALAMGTLGSGERPWRSRTGVALTAIAGACLLAAAVGPDDFGTSHGTLLRERLVLLGMAFLVPLFRGGDSSRTSRLAQVCLAVIVVFQGAACWEYALRSSVDAREVLAVGDIVGKEPSLASVIVLEDGRRFHSNPAAQMSNFLAIGRRTIVWDNYELGYDLFPVVAARPEDRAFILAFTSVSVFDQEEASADAEARFSKLEACLSANHEKIATILLWRRDSRVEALLARWYESEPFVTRGRVRLFRRRADRVSDAELQENSTAARSRGPREPRDRSAAAWAGAVRTSPRG